MFWAAVMALTLSAAVDTLLNTPASVSGINRRPWLPLLATGWEALAQGTPSPPLCLPSSIQALANRRSAWR